MQRHDNDSDTSRCKLVSREIRGIALKAAVTVIIRPCTHAIMRCFMSAHDTCYVHTREPALHTLKAGTVPHLLRARLALLVAARFLSFSSLLAALLATRSSTCRSVMWRTKQTEHAESKVQGQHLRKRLRATHQAGLCWAGCCQRCQEGDGTKAKHLHKDARQRCK